MPYPLSEAIVAGNVDRVQTLVANRDALGIDLNSVDGYNTAIHEVYFAHLAPNVARDMTQIFLDARDTAGNLVINLNWAHVNAGTALTVAISTGNVGLVEQILDARNADGSLAVDLLSAGQHGSFWSPLTRALFMNRREIVEFLVDARQENGQPILTRDDLINSLNGAHANGATRAVDNESTRWLRNHLNLQTVQQPANMMPPQVATPQVPPPAPRQNVRDGVLNQFANASQNTHNTEVTISVEASINRLKARYGLSNVAAHLAAIEAHINSSQYTANEKSVAQSCLQRIKTTVLTRSGIDLTQSQVLSLVWQACEDRNAIVDGQIAPLSDEDINHRKRQLIKCLVDAQTTYGPNNPACFVGTLNKMVEALDRTHPDVTIITGAAVIMPIATEQATKAVGKALQKKAARAQRAILLSWYVDDSNRSEKTAATQFRTEMVSTVGNQLKDDFRTLLTEEKRDEITGNFEYLRRPTVHKELDSLIQRVKTIPSEGKSQRLTLALTALQQQADQAYNICDRSFQQEYELLSEAYNKFEQLEQKILSTPEDVVNVHRNQAINKLKSLVDETQASLSQSDVVSIAKATNDLESRLEAFSSFDDFAKSIMPKIEANYRGTSEIRLAAIEEIKNLINSCYLSYSRSDPADECKGLLMNGMNSIKHAVVDHHKQYGKGRLFKQFQPESKLVRAINISLNS